MKTSLICTVLNEENSVIGFLNSAYSQTKKVDEIVIIDGGSTDKTISKISEFQIPGSSRAKIKLIFKKGNRAMGRNEAIKRSSSEIIVCSDAGCILDKDWVKNIVKPFEDPRVDVVAGYYRGIPENVFEECLIPYALVMPDKVNRDNFLPATRSVAFKKTIWRKVGGFPEEFRNNEDYVFAKRLKQINAKIVFEKEAIVYWRPRSNIKDAFIMFYRFAKGDSESRIFRPKVLLIFVRYVAFFIFLSLFFLLKSYFILYALCFMLLLYILWSVIKNYKYVRDIRAILYLPLLQFTSDLAVILGTTLGFIVR